MLNEGQHRGVHAPGHALITACPGSGKTTVLAQRAAYLLTCHPASLLAAVTFTTDAAEELTHRIVSLSKGSESRIHSGTFHKLAKNQLLAAGRRLSLATEAQAADFRRAAATDIGPCAFTVEEIMLSIEAQKSQAQPDPTLSRDDPRVRAKDEYQRSLERFGLMDFTDLIIQAVAGMEDGSVSPLPVDFLLVDEVQDADEIQWAWILAHAKAGKKVTTVGDDDQAIYGWRHACGYRGMQHFVRVTDAQHIRLDTTYRCAPEILSCAGRLIQHNTERVEKSLVTASRLRGVVRSERVASRQDEAEILAYTLAQGDPAQWAVLGRANALLDRIEIALTDSSVPYVRIGGRSFWEQPGPALYLSALTAFAKDDYLAVHQLLAKRGVPSRALESLSRLVQPKREASLSRFIGLPSTHVHGDAEILELQAKVKLWHRHMRSNQIPLVTHGIAGWMEDNLGKRILRMPLTPCANSINKRSGTLTQRLLGLQQSQEKERQGVTLMTLHSSKGLEFDKVWIIGCEHGVLPHKTSDLAEERRLAYVGITRARQELVMSYMIDDKSQPSPFLREAGLI